MTPGFKPISTDFATLAKCDFDVIVVGSGYGGSVAASRLARCGKSVAVLERGREIVPGEYPRDAGAVSGAFQTTLSGDTIGERDALFDLRVFDDMTVLVGCGLGGTSLINANVAIAPEPRVFDAWPQPPEGDWPTALAPHLAQARAMLGSTSYPAHKTPPKLHAMQRIAAGLGRNLQRPDINVTFRDGPNAAGIWQPACVDCGDCVTGCNYGAKNTTLMNYLPDAHAFGATLVTGAEVLTVARIAPKTPDAAPRWHVTARPVTDAPAAPARGLTGDVVILAAGTLGSTEILLRSAADLPLSPRLGHGFSGNGDSWSLGFNANMPDETGRRAAVYAIGAGPHGIPPGPAPTGPDLHRPGPCITGMIHVTDPALDKTVMIEEGVIPGAFAAACAVGIPGLATLESDPFRYGDLAQRAGDMADLAANITGDPAKLADSVYDGPVSRTLPFLTFSHDAAAGGMTLRHGRVSVSWEGAGQDAALAHSDAALKKACDTIQAEYLRFPTALDAFGNRTMVVHPLGGCAIGADATTGVVDTECRVFDGRGDVHQGLYVMDGAIIPTALGANPHLTITALAERAVTRLAEARHWHIDWAPPPDRQSTPTDSTPDYAQVLKQVIDGLQAIATAIDGKAFELARLLLMGAWRQVIEFARQRDDRLTGGRHNFPTVERFIRYFGTPEALVSTTGPIIGQFLDILVPLQMTVDKGDLPALLVLLERKLGDFSPAARFPEEMAGHISPIGVDDPESGFDAHDILGEGAWPCHLKATLTADRIAALGAEPVGSAEMKHASFTCAGLGGTFHLTGTFKFLALDPRAVDRWRVTYDGRLTHDDGTSFMFRGRKTLQHRKGGHWWRDLCDLDVDILDGDTPVARGRMQVSLENAIRQAHGFDVRYDDLTDAPQSVWDRIKETVGGGADWPICKRPDVSKLPALFRETGFRVLCAKAALAILDADAAKTRAPAPSEQVAQAFKARFLARAAGLVFRSYGGIYAYGVNFPYRDLQDTPPARPDLPTPEILYPEPEPGVVLKLTRYRKPRPDGAPLKGPVILANGFGVKASAFAVPTTFTNIVEMLVEDGFDVWLFDYRGSGDAAGSTTRFTIDDVAQKDWPAAIDMVLARTGAAKVQVLAHCVGSLSLFMAVLAGERRIRSIIASQVGAHGIVNWFKNAQFDAQIGGAVANGLPPALWPLVDMLGLDDELATLARTGLPVVDVRAPTETYSAPLNAAMDALLWSVPHFSDVPCKNPTCHRINFVYGPTYRHENLNQATHNYIHRMFGPVSSTPFLHLALMFDAGKLLSATLAPDGTVRPDGKTRYYDGHANLDMPVHFFSGAQNPEILPEATLRSYHWLRRVNERPDRYTRHVYQGYGHMDCFVGRDAWKDIFPDLLALLNDPEKAAKRYADDT